jgi:kumamolisin
LFAARVAATICEFGARSTHSREGIRIFHRRLAIAGFIALAASTSLNAQAAPASSQRLAHANLTPGLQHAVKLGHSDPNRVLKIAVSLGLQHTAALDSFIAQVSNRRSPVYGHYQTPAQFSSLYGQTADNVKQVADFLRLHGLTVASVSPTRTLIDATGPVSAVEAAFGITIFDWHDPALNRDFFGNDTQPSLPSSIAPLVVGVMGLNNHYPQRRLGATSPHVGGGPGGGYTPDQLKTAYDVQPLAAAAHDGAGQNIGLFELAGFDQGNINTYDLHYYNRTLNPVAFYLVDGGPANPAFGQVESELDIEAVHAFAPGASVTVWEGFNSDVGSADTYSAMVNSNITQVNSTSWGDCEPNVINTAGYVGTLDGLFQQAAAQGQTFFAATGDYGPYDCNQAGGNTTNLAVDYPASDPFVTAVGGTSLNLNANNTYQSESAWFTSNSPPLGSGGGLSTFFARPGWQTGPGVSNVSSNGARQVPDVALDADPFTGFSIFTTDKGTTGWGVAGGTSAGAPSWAAMAAIYNQYAAVPQTRGGRLGFANPSIYTLASGSEASPPFHDITTGTNPHANYSPTAGWDYSTGWGTPDAGNLIPELLAINFPIRPWVPVAEAGSTGAAPPPKPRSGWLSISRQPAVASVTSSLPLVGRVGEGVSSSTSSSFTPAGSVGQRVSSWASWFVPQAIERLMRFIR